MSPSWPEIRSPCLCLPYAMITGLSDHTSFQCIVELPSWLLGRFSLLCCLLYFWANVWLLSVLPSASQEGCRFRASLDSIVRSYFTRTRQGKSTWRYYFGFFDSKGACTFTENKHCLLLEVCLLWMSLKIEKKKMPSLHLGLCSFCCLEVPVSCPTISHPSPLSLPFQPAPILRCIRVFFFSVAMTKYSNQSNLKQKGFILAHSWRSSPSWLGVHGGRLMCALSHCIWSP